MYGRDRGLLTGSLRGGKKRICRGGHPDWGGIRAPGPVIGRGHNKRVQQGSGVLHGEMDALENAGRQPASVYKNCTFYTTLLPCPMCSGTISLYGIPGGREQN